jgi:RNA-directed DNA polymerase
MMNEDGKSDEIVVPTKRPNEGRSLPEEAVEGRVSTMGNVHRFTACRTQRRDQHAHDGLARVREVARRNRNERFTALLHHVTIERLGEAFSALSRSAAPGVDGVTWDDYARNVGANIRDLHARVQSGTYRAKPSRRVMIPKPDGGERPLGIAALEDKIVQRATAEVLNAVYEADFIGFSYGFRPGRSQHHALDALAVGILRNHVNWVLDVDIRGFFDAMDHGWLQRFVEHRIADKRVVALILRWLRAGILVEEQLRAAERGSPQGATISPLLSNVYLHYVFDLWAARWRRRAARGAMIIVRYADDIVVGFQHEADARRFRDELTARVGEFALELHAEKTRLLRFGKLAALQRKSRGERKPETFDFLGFTHICGKSRAGRFVLFRHTSRKRMQRRLRTVREDLMRRRHLPIPKQGKWIRQVVSGYFAYHAIPTNSARLVTFRNEITRAWRHALRRRSQRGQVAWSRMEHLADRWIPRARILHPWPDERFDARTQGRSRVR